MINPSLVSRTLDLAVAIQQIPAPAFAEGRRAQFLRSRFSQEGLEVDVDDLGNVFARLVGDGSAPPLVISAHTDTVFPETTNLQVTITAETIFGPGIGDNSLGVAGLFGLAWALRAAAGEKSDRILPGDLWLVANVGEEGLGDLRGMRAVVNRFGKQPLGYIVLEGLALGQVYHRALGARRYRITARTPGGHSWVDHGRPSAIQELAVLVTRLAALRLPAKPRTTLNVGVIAGGTSVNTIAAEAYLELDLRSEGTRTLTNLVKRVEAVVIEANRPEVVFTAEEIGYRPTGEIAPDHPLVELALRSLEAVGVQPHLNIGSTDANYPLSRGLPALCVGLTTGGGAHTLTEYIHTQPLAQGLDQLVRLVEGVYFRSWPAHLSQLRLAPP